jgi:hypothetical protein
VTHLVAINSTHVNYGTRKFRISLAEQDRGAMLLPKFKRTGPIWGLVGFILGALLSGTAVGTLGHSASILPHSQKDALRGKVDSPHALSQIIILPAVKSDEIDGAISDLPKIEQLRVRQDLQNRKYRLLWLTVWDWDVSAVAETGDTVSIFSDEYRRQVTLRNRRTRIAIPEPRSGYIELRGDATEDGIIAISLLSGTQPIALPRMVLGQIVKIDIDTY